VFYRPQPVEASGTIKLSNIRAASACMPGRTCW